MALENIKCRQASVASIHGMIRCAAILGAIHAGTLEHLLIHEFNKEWRKLVDIPQAIGAKGAQRKAQKLASVAKFEEYRLGWQKPDEKVPEDVMEAALIAVAMGRIIREEP